MRHSRYIPLFIISFGLLALAFMVSVSVGPAAISLPQTFDSLLSPFIASNPIDWQHTIIMQIRLPRACLAILVGASLALCGAILQGVFRNPLASPSVIGVSSGASLGAVIAIYLGLAAISAWALPAFAFIGGALTLLLVYAIATQNGYTPISTLLLAGVAVGAFNIAMSALILAFALEQWDVGKSIVYWTMGGIDGRGWQHVFLLAPILFLGLGVALFFSHELDILLMGESHAYTVGIDVARLRLIMLLVTSVLVGAAISVAGGIGFIGLVVPHIARLFSGPQHRRLLPLSVLLGALLLLVADILVRGSATQSALPLGVVTAALGAPFFVFLLLQQRKLLRV